MDCDICWWRVGLVALCWWVGGAICTGAYGEVSSAHWRTFWEVTGVLWTLAGAATALVSTIAALHEVPFRWMLEK